MLGFDRLNEFRILRVINVGTEGDVIHRYLPGYLRSFQRGDFFRLVHDVLRMKRISGYQRADWREGGQTQEANRA
jgi:hypothetical protein